MGKGGVENHEDWTERREGLLSGGRGGRLRAGDLESFVGEGEVDEAGGG